MIKIWAGRGGWRGCSWQDNSGIQVSKHNLRPERLGWHYRSAFKEIVPSGRTEASMKRSLWRQKSPAGLVTTRRPVTELWMFSTDKMVLKEVFRFKVKQKNYFVVQLLLSLHVGMFKSVICCWKFTCWRGRTDVKQMWSTGDGIIRKLYKLWQPLGKIEGKLVAVFRWWQKRSSLARVATCTVAILGHFPQLSSVSVRLCWTLLYVQVKLTF